jgi:PIN domain nuclease of toxin-antitoxin system
VILLDTHVLLWLAGDARKLSSAALKALKDPDRYVADISLREVAALERSGRILLDEPVLDWLEDALEEHQIQVAPITPRIASRSTRIAQNFHGDPADQLIAATSIELRAPLVTADEALRASPALQTIW